MFQCTQNRFIIFLAVDNIGMLIHIIDELILKIAKKISLTGEVRPIFCFVILLGKLVG